MRSNARWMWIPVLSGLGACASDRSPVPDPVITLPAPTAAASAPERELHGVIALRASRDGFVAFEMRAPLESQRARFTGEALDGDLSLDVDDPSRSRGQVTIDLSLLRIERSEHEDAAPASAWSMSERQNEHARDWLELDRDSAAFEKNRRAALRVDSISVERERQSEQGLSADVVLVGSLTLHQHVEPVAIPGEIEIVRSARAPRARFHTREPFLVDLEPYGIAPRDALGKLLAKGFDALAPKVARRASVMVDLTFE